MENLSYNTSCHKSLYTRFLILVYIMHSVFISIDSCYIPVSIIGPIVFSIDVNIMTADRLTLVYTVSIQI